MISLISKASLDKFEPVARGRKKFFLGVLPLGKAR